MWEKGSGGAAWWAFNLINPLNYMSF